MLGEDGSRKVSKPFLDSEIVNQPLHWCCNIPMGKMVIPGLSCKIISLIKLVYN